MKNYLFFTLIALMMIGFSGCKEKVNKSEEIAKIRLVLDNHVIANETKNIDLIENIWAKRDDVIIFGTASDEKLVGWNEIKDTFEKQFKMFEQAYLSISDQSISVGDYGKTAWFSQKMDYNYTTVDGDAKRFEGVRFTGVLEKIDDQWFIVQSHLSIPYSSMEKEKYSR